jgi:hypothetical protein
MFTGVSWPRIRANAKLQIMSKVEQLEQQIQSLSAQELAEFRDWFSEFDWAVWDRKLERDAASGKLDKFAERALKDYTSGKTTPL